MKNAKTHEQFIELRAAGRSYAEICDQLHVSKTTLVEWAKQYRREISNLKAMELDALQRRLKLNEEARIEMFGDMLARLKEEFAKRDLTTIPTEKLVDQVAKITTLIAEQKVARFSVKKDLFEDSDHQFVTWAV